MLACYCNSNSDTDQIERAVHHLHGVHSSMTYTTWKISVCLLDCHSHCDEKQSWNKRMYRRQVNYSPWSVTASTQPSAALLRNDATTAACSTWQLTASGFKIKANTEVVVNFSSTRYDSSSSCECRMWALKLKVSIYRIHMWGVYWSRWNLLEASFG